MSEGEGDMEMVSQVKVQSTKLFDVWEEEWKFEANSKGDIDIMKMKSVRNKAGDYAGEEGVAKMLDRYGIAPELIDADSDVCTIGWSEHEQKYYGWSHRAGVGFGMGDMIFEEDFDDDALFIEHGSVRIRNKTDARQSAVNFARNVS